MDPSVFVHPTAVVDTDDIGRGTRVWAYVHLQKNCHIGEDCNLCDYSGVGFDTVIGDRVTLKEYSGIGQGTIVEDDVFIGPGVYTPNDSVPRSPRMKEFPEIAKRYEETSSWLQQTRLCRGASIGTAAVIAPGITVGEFAMVGIAAVVTKDVPPHGLVAGHPARRIGWVCFCGIKLEREEDEALACPACDRRFVQEEDRIRHVDDPG